MPEAVRAVTGWALDQPGIYRVWAVCNVENIASCRVMEKVGMQKEGILRRWSIHPNISEEPCDSYCYAVTN
jgi:RimJ/RimL family protein N-acetyltransferase